MVFINMALRGSKEMHGEHVNYNNMQSYTCCAMQPLKGVEYFVLWVAPCEFYLEKFALVRNLEKSGSNNPVLSVVAPIVHSSNTCSFLDVLVVVKLLAHSFGQLLIGRVHKWGMQFIAVVSREFKCNGCIGFGILLVGGMVILIGLELLIS